MRVGLYAAPLSLDPHLENEFLTSAVLANAFEGLTSLDGAMRVEPALAVSWDTPGPSTWRFRLRPGARFQDGRPVGARDVVWSLERARRHPRSGVSHYLADVVDVRVAAPDVVEIRTQASTLAPPQPARLRRHRPRGLPGRDPVADRHRAVPAGDGGVPRGPDPAAAPTSTGGGARPSRWSGCSW